MFGALSVVNDGIVVRLFVRSNPNLSFHILKKKKCFFFLNSFASAFTLPIFILRGRRAATKLIWS